jgi:hypothetical protein
MAPSDISQRPARPLAGFGSASVSAERVTMLCPAGSGKLSKIPIGAGDRLATRHDVAIEFQLLNMQHPV